MSDERKEFRVGLLVLMALLVAGGLIIRFGELDNLWQRRYTVVIGQSRTCNIMAPSSTCCNFTTLILSGTITSAMLCFHLTGRLRYVQLGDTFAVSN